MSQQNKAKLLNPEQIAKRRIPLEDAQVKSSSGKWYCHFCERKFSLEQVYLKHYCEKRMKREQLASPIGQAAFSYYNEWMKMKKYSAQSAEAFLDSKYYRSFINFAQLVIVANIARPDKYMQLMTEGEILPVLWCREQCYAVYLEWNDKLSDPLDQVQTSINYLIDICEKENTSLDRVFKHLGPQRILSLVRQRRLTPWLIFCSPTFGKILNEMDQSQRVAFNNVVNASYWGDRFQTERSTINHIKDIVREMAL